MDAHRQNRVTGVTNIRPRLSGLLRLDVGGPDYLAPLLGFVGDKFSKVGGRHRHRRAAQIGYPRLHRGIREPALISLLSVSMISAGVFLGAPRPNHPLAS